MAAFLDNIDTGVWTLVPVTERLLRRVAALIGAAPSKVYLRAGDAVHVACAQEAGEIEIWTNDRHLLGAMAHFGITGRTV